MQQPTKLLFALILATLFISSCGNKPTELTLPEEITTTEATNAN